MIRIFFLSQSSPILELFPFDKITLKSYICTVVTVMAKQCWSQTVLESGSWGHSVLQTPALVVIISKLRFKCPVYQFYIIIHCLINIRQKIFLFSMLLDLIFKQFSVF